MHMCRVQCAHDKPTIRTFVSNPWCPLWLHESSLSKTSCKCLRALENHWKKTLFILYCGSEKKILTKLSWFELLPSLASSKLSWQMLKTIFESKEVLWYNIIKSVFVTSGIMNVFSSAFSLCADNTYRETYSFLPPRNLNFRPSQKPNRTIVLFSKWFEPK